MQGPEELEMDLAMLAYEVKTLIRQARSVCAGLQGPQGTLARANCREGLRSLQRALASFQEADGFKLDPAERTEFIMEQWGSALEQLD